MNINKININQTEQSYYIASDIYDVTANNNDVTFSSLSELLSAENLSTLIPTAVRSGGMTIRFVQNTDNKYVQYRLMTSEWSLNESDWQGVDEVPTVGSNNLVKSGGVADVIEVNTQAIKNILFAAIPNVNEITEKQPLDLNTVEVGSCFAVGGGDVNYILNKPVDLTSINICVITSKVYNTSKLTGGIFQLIIENKFPKHNIWMRFAWGSGSKLKWEPWEKISGANSVGTTELKDGAVTKEKLAANSLEVISKCLLIDKGAVLNLTEDNPIDLDDVSLAGTTFAIAHGDM